MIVLVLSCFYCDEDIASEFLLEEHDDISQAKQIAATIGLPAVASVGERHYVIHPYFRETTKEAYYLYTQGCFALHRCTKEGKKAHLLAIKPIRIDPPSEKSTKKP